MFSRRRVAAWTRPLIDGMGFGGGALRVGSLFIPDRLHPLNKPLGVIYLYPRLPVNARIAGRHGGLPVAVPH